MYYADTTDILAGLAEVNDTDPLHAHDLLDGFLEGSAEWDDEEDE